MSERVPLIQMLGMWARRVNVRRILKARRLLVEAGISEVSIAQLETHELSGGDVTLCVQAMIDARRRGLPCEWFHVMVIDLAGRDPLAAVHAGADLKRVIGGPEYQGLFKKPLDAPAVHR